jgi:hypothetical protein
MVECGIDMVRGDKGESGVSQKPGHAGGVRLLLDDGSSRFIAFEYPAKALAAIQEAIKSND